MLTLKISKVKLKNIKWLFIFCFLSPLYVQANHGEDALAIFTANQNLPTMTSGKAKMLFKGKVKRLGGEKFILVDWPNGTDNKVNFYYHLLGQTEAKVNSYRAKLIFSGKGFPPKVIDKNNFSSLKESMQEHKNAISYAPLSDISDEFKILFVIPEGE